MSVDRIARIRARVQDVPDFPKPGILFRDITPLLGDAGAFSDAIALMAEPFAGQGIDAVLGIESRGFMFAAPLALALSAAFVPVRKPGKLPWRKHRNEYALEYGTDALEVHQDAFEPGDRVVVVDDVLATGGTAAAAGELVRRLGAEVVAYSIAIELSFLNGRNKLGTTPVNIAIQY